MAEDQTEKGFSNSGSNVPGSKFPEQVSAKVYNVADVATGDKAEIKDLTNLGVVNGTLVDGILRTAVQASRSVGKEGGLSSDDAKQVYDTSIKIVNNLGITKPDEINTRIKKIENALDNDQGAFNTKPIRGEAKYDTY